MAEPELTDPPPSERDVPELPPRILATYARLFQLETWLRHMVYVELRAQHGDAWRGTIRPFERSFEADKRLTHMPTPEEDPLSYAPFSELQRLISSNWDLFKGYLPPRSIWDAKLEEVSQIRNRVAHFRMGHADDYPRILQFLRDIDQGFWKFCTSYNNPQPVLPQADDPVETHFLPHDPFPWTEVDERKWARVGHAPPGMVLSMTVEGLRRPWVSPSHSIDGKVGYLYDVWITARDQRAFDYGQLLDGTKAVHRRLVHLCLDSHARSLRVTIPAVLGAAEVIGVIEHAFEAARYAVGTSRPFILSGDGVQTFADQWPEFVLGPKNPLTFLTPDMPSTFFNA